jgi:hypothetical protein
MTRWCCRTARVVMTAAARCPTSTSEYIVCEGFGGWRSRAQSTTWHLSEWLAACCAHTTPLAAPPHHHHAGCLS